MHLEAKVQHLLQKQMFAFGDRAQACFVILGQDHALVESAPNRIVKESKLPENRFVRMLDNGSSRERGTDRFVVGFKMTLDDFRQSLTATEPPTGLSHSLSGLWWDAKGDWVRAHESAQQDEGIEGSWVHAYLHRKEGDQSNAAYWYNRAGKPVCQEPLDAEWLSIVRALLQ